MRPILALVLLLLVGCNSDTVSLLDPPSTFEQDIPSVALSFDFVSTETAWDAPSADGPQKTSATTRATSTTPPTRIALRVFKTDGTPVLDQIDQSQGDASFGRFAGLRLAPGAYKCVIVAHRASAADKAAATISSLTDASISEDDLWDTFATVYDLTVAADTYATQEKQITVPLCVTRLNITILDAIPSGVSKIRFSLNSGSSTAASAPIALNPTAGIATTDLAYTRTWDIKAEDINQSGKSFAITGLFTAYPKACDAKVEALSSEGTPLFTRTLQNITFNRGKIRKVSTNLFTGSVDATINFEEWEDEDQPVIIP